MDKVVVLMSTYNGEKYLREQMDSLLRQEGVAVEIFVRDDGSTDSTVSIIEDYANKNSNVHLNIGKNLGVGNSFMNLVEHAPDDFDYYAFSDQDDIWLENKLSKAIEVIKDIDGPTLYCSNQTLVDSEGEKIALRYNKVLDLSTEQILFVNRVQGCTALWNSDLQKILSTQLPSRELLICRIHDVWVGMVASVCGKIIYDENSYILYRQHENNVVGAKESSRLDLLQSKVKKLRNKTFRNSRSLMAKEMVRLFPIDASKHSMLTIAADSKSLAGKKRIIQNYKSFTTYSGEKKADFILKVLLNFF